MKTLLRRVGVGMLIALQWLYRTGRSVVLRCWRQRYIVGARRVAVAADLLLYDVLRVWLDLWLASPKRWPPPHPRIAARVRRCRRVLMAGLRTIAERSAIPIRVVGAVQLGKNVLGCYRHEGALPQINILDVRQDDPWVLAHELGHHFAIARGDTREAAADEEARGLVGILLRDHLAELRPLVHERLPADGYSRVSLWGSPSAAALLFLIGLVVLLAGSANVGRPMLFGSIFHMWAFMMFNIGKSQKRVDPYFYQTPLSARDRRIEKLKRLAFDRGANPGEVRNALAEITRLSKGQP